MMNSTLALPPCPSLEQRHLRPERVNTELGDLEALVPAAAPYLCEDAGAPALVLVPGLGVDGLTYLRQLPLGSRARIRLFQLPNEPAAGEAGLAAFARCVEAYLAGSGLAQRPGGIVLGGSSMGGAVSLIVAQRARIKLRGLVLIGTFGSAKHLPAWQRFCAPLAHVLPPSLVRACAWQLLSRLNYFGTVSHEEAVWLTTNKIQRTRRYFGLAVGALTAFDAVEAAKGLGVPTLVLHGTKDRVLPFEAGQELARVIPGAKFVAVADAGHALYFTHYQLVNAAIAEFLGQGIH